MSPLPTEARNECLYLARKALHEFLRRQQEPRLYQPVHPVLREPRGAFVTLKRHGELRGCIGYVEAIKPLWETIEDCAISAASRDPRFEPVAAEELADLDIEISVLSPLEDLPDPAGVEVGRHGILIEKGYHRGLLLPQVATEYGWNREQFLAHTCLKAGLPMDAWRHGAKIKVFSADVFGEEEPGRSGPR